MAGARQTELGYGQKGIKHQGRCEHDAERNQGAELGEPGHPAEIQEREGGGSGER